MSVLQSIAATDDPSAFAVRFNRTDGRAVDVTVRLHPGDMGAVSAVPDLTTVGRWRNVNDVRSALIPAVQAFATALETLAFDD